MTSTNPAPDVGGRSTLEDVAARAGVSRATVSRVVNGSPQVSDTARCAVEAAIEAIGYAPNRAARSLGGHRSEMIALVVSEPSVRLFADPFFAGTTLGITAALGSTPYQLVLMMTQSDTTATGRCATCCGAAPTARRMSRSPFFPVSSSERGPSR